MSVRGVDLSNYQDGVSRARMQRWAASGVQHVVVRCSLEDDAKDELARRQLQDAQAAGLSTSVYVWCYFTADDPREVATAAIALVDDLRPTLYWLDAEETQAVYRDPGANIGWLATCVTALEAAGKRVGIYTGRYYWRDHLADTTEFADLPLWLADYDGEPDLNVWTPFAGWTQLAGKQFAGSDTGQLDGMALDLDVFDEAVVQGDGPVPDLRQAFLAEIRQHFGTPYVFGAKGPVTFDCSGLLTYCARQVGLDLGDPLMTSADGLKNYCDPISMNEAQPGDLYLFSETYGDGGPDYATHCGAALGDGTHMLDDHGDPWPGCGQTDISGPYWQEHLMGAWRPRGFGAPSEEDDPVKVAELENTIDYLKGDVADAFESAIATLEQTPRLPKAARDAVAGGLRPALETLRRGGPPEDGG